MRQLGDAIYELGDLFAEVAANIAQCHGCVFDRVVEQSCRQHRHRRAEILEDGCHRQAVIDVRLSRRTFLAQVPFFRHTKGALEHLSISGRGQFRQAVE